MQYNEEAIKVIFENEDFIAINKPHGLLVHRTKMAADATEFALQKVRNHLSIHVYPAHRLDRKTSGALLFSKSKKVDAKMQQLFRERQVKKGYRAIVRGFVDPVGSIDYPLKNGAKSQEAHTNYRLIRQFEIDLPSANNDTSRYSLVDLRPLTGRYHQLRKHMAHIFHPIIGDRPHGCNKQNRLWKEHFNMTTMMLCATSLEFEWREGHLISIQADVSKTFRTVLGILLSRAIIKPDAV